ncbi:hypothetical protein MPER_10739, partial [Moniliophthora perniciosa FA553]
MICAAGSNPNNDVTTRNYPTEYRVEFYSPPYLSQPRPTYTGLPATVNFGSTFTLSVTLPSGVNGASVWAMDLGFATHGVHMDSRAVKLVSTLSSDKRTLTVTGPPNGRIYPPGPAFIYVVTDAGVPSFGRKTIIGTGASPPVDQGAIDNMLRSTSGPSLLADGPVPTEGEGSHVATDVIPALAHSLFNTFPFYGTQSGGPRKKLDHFFDQSFHQISLLLAQTKNFFMRYYFLRR